MPKSTPQDDRWSKIWDARIVGLSQLLGSPDDSVYHATIPFEFRDLGGSADVVPFPNYISGMTYVTSELTGEDVGQIPSSLGNYELAICTQSDLPRAVDLIASLACYTCDSVLEPGHTMDISNFFEDSTIRALLFSKLADNKSIFRLEEMECGILLCIGITSEELTYSRENGSDRLIEILKEKSVFPYTIPDRSSVIGKDGA